jgi:hypothetical protein
VKEFSILGLAETAKEKLKLAGISKSERVDFERLEAGINQAEITQKKSRALFEDLASGLPDGDLAFVHNIGLLAVQSNLVNEAYAIGMDMMDYGHPSSTVGIAAKGLTTLPQSEDPVFHEMLTAAAQLGQIRARSFMWGHKLRKIGPLRHIALLPIRLGIAVHGLTIWLKKPKDIRVDVGTSTKPPFRKRK